MKKKMETETSTEEPNHGTIITSTVPGSFEIDSNKYFKLKGVEEALRIMEESPYFPKVDFKELAEAS